MSLPPFPPEYRATGWLLHVTSLPRPYRVGDVGPEKMIFDPAFERLRGLTNPRNVPQYEKLQG